MKKTPKWFYIILVVIPIIIMILLESGLRIFSYGINLEQWVNISEGKLILNPDIGARYFTSTKNYPHSNHDSFDEIKKENTKRIFVLGGSSAAGFPFSPSGAFSRYIRDYLEIKYPSNQIEVVNLGITAVNTYTIADLVPGIIDQRPDLIIIYAGHNEYYGALGVGSLESIGNSAFLIDSYLYLNKFKTFQLIKNIIKGSAELLFSDNNSAAGSTLMARMAQEKSIPLNSDVYNYGVQQFKTNLDFILQAFNKNKIPILIGTLTSNLKDQRPFVSIEKDNMPAADIVFSDAQKEMLINNYSKADSLFRYAKDLDALRFRAPEKFNKIIIEYADKYNCTLVNIDSIFSTNSEGNIVGNNLMVDHLHPTLHGYQLMGRTFSESIVLNNYLNTSTDKNYSSEIIDSIVCSNFAFSKLDSTISHLTIINLLNDWPFVKKKENILQNVKLNNRIDSLAYKVVKEDFNWEAAHQEAYKWYLGKGNINNFEMELKVLHSQYPFKHIYLSYAAQELLKLKLYNEAKYFLEKKYKIEPDEFTIKWLGNISLFNNRYNDAINYLKECLTYNNNDAQTYFNLSVAYLKTAEYKSALVTINKCLDINSNYSNAEAMRNQLEVLIKKPL